MSKHSRELLDLTLKQIADAQIAHDKTVAAMRAEAKVVHGVVSSEQESQRIREGQQVAAEARVRELDAAHQAKIDALRAEALGYLVDAKADAEVARYKALEALGPSTPEEWGRADSRALFIQEDLGTLEPSEIVDTYSLAVRSGDRIGAWLIHRYGSRLLSERTKAAENMGIAARANLAAIELDRVHHGPLYAELRDADRELATLGQQLERPVTGGEKMRTAADARDKLGIVLPVEMMVAEGIVDNLAMP